MPFDSVFGIISNLGTYIGRLFILFTVFNALFVQLELNTGK